MEMMLDTTSCYLLNKDSISLSVQTDDRLLVKQVYQFHESYHLLVASTRTMRTHEIRSNRQRGTMQNIRAASEDSAQPSVHHI